jgi:hypothetical protein
MLLIGSLALPSVASAKSRKKRVKSVAKSEDLRMWDGSVADVDWVSDNPRPRPAIRTPEERDWLSFVVTAGHRVFQLDTPMIQQDEKREAINAGQFQDLIETKNSLELRMLVHPFRFLSLGAAWHTDDSHLKINGGKVPIAPQEILGMMQVGPRFGFVRLYGFYSQILFSRSQATIDAPTVVGAEQDARTFKVDVKQKGGEAGIGTQFHWGPLGFHAEAVRSLQRSYDLSLTQADGVQTFQASAQPSFKAWQFGLSLNF